MVQAGGVGSHGARRSPHRTSPKTVRDIAIEVMQRQGMGATDACTGKVVTKLVHNADPASRRSGRVGREWEGYGVEGGGVSAATQPRSCGKSTMDPWSG